MKGKNILDAMSDLAPETLTENEGKNSRRAKTLRVLLVAAAVLLLVGAVVAGAIIANRKAPIEGPGAPAETSQKAGGTETEPSVVKAVAATVFIDVNPSVKIEIDEENKVLSLAAINADGEVLLENFDYTDKGLDGAVAELVSLLIEKGYLTHDNNLLLLSVSSEDEKYSAALCGELRATVNGVFEKELPEGEVIAQILVSKDALLDCAKQYCISWGKAKLVLMLKAKDETLDPAKLAKMTLTDLKALCREKEVDFSPEAALSHFDAEALAYADAGVEREQLQAFGQSRMNGTDSFSVAGVNFIYNGEYYSYTYDTTSAVLLSKLRAPFISEEEAIEIACKEWGVPKNKIVRTNVSVMNNSFPKEGMNYIVVLRNNSVREFEVKIDALSGEVLSKEERAMELDIWELRDIAAADAGIDLPRNIDTRSKGLDSELRLLSFVYEGKTYSYIIHFSTGEIFDKEVFVAPGDDAPFEYVNEALAGRLAVRTVKERFALPDAEILDCTVEKTTGGATKSYSFKFTLAAGDERYTCSVSDQANIYNVSKTK